MKLKYQKEYKLIKKRKLKSPSDKEFLSKYKNLEEYINNHNNLFLQKERLKHPILDNINGYPLDEYQSRVVLSNEENTLVIAGAGSGKSLTIIGKIIYLTKDCYINPNDILCISFTNEATNNLKKTLYQKYNINIDIYTFHKLALKILANNQETFTIAPDDYLQSCIDDFFTENNNKSTKIKRIIKALQKNDSLQNIKKIIYTFINLYKSNSYDLSYFQVILHKMKKTINIKRYLREKKLLILIINIFIKYEKELQEENALDFNDMINKSISSIKNNGLKQKWKYIIIDEYQDTSYTKFNMIKEIINITNAKLLAVGDDFQSIYRFTGCNLNIFLNFQNLLPNSKIFYIVNTYRNPQEIINIAGSFIMKNKKQQRKTLKSPKKLDRPLIISFNDDRITNFKKTLISIDNSSEIMVLGRNNHDLEKYIDSEINNVKDNIYNYKSKTFKYLTIHSSKGLESDVVIIINVEDNNLGIPSKIKSEHIIKYVNNEKDYYPYEEERRLFYVGLTRTKTYTYLLTTNKNPSIFIKELKKYSKWIKIIK